MHIVSYGPQAKMTLPHPRFWKGSKKPGPYYAK